MANRRRNSGLSAALFGATGWLFADLLLALAMMFLLAEPSGQTIAGPPPRPICTPVPTPLAALNLTPIKFNVTGIDPAGIPNNGAAIANAQSQVRAGLAGNETSRAGLVEVYGGASDINPSAAIANANTFATNVLQPLGAQNFVFYGNVVYQPLLNLGNPSSTTELVIFVFQKAQPPVPAPNSDCATVTPLS